jgi:murein DD-endopeptidase MepM/ murein hydrolase activator NlpD
MLPLMIFNAIGSFFSGNPDASEPNMVLNDTAAIVENIETVGSSLNVILLESLDALYLNIDSDFAESGGGRKVIINPYEGGNIVDANLIISQYCAANDMNFEKIALSDLEQTVRANQSSLFSFEKRSTVVTYTEEGVETSETVVSYTIVYSGDTHFADAVFFLTEEQKALAGEYSNNLHIFLNASMSVTANRTTALLAQLALDNPYSGDVEAFGSPFAADWQSAVTSEFGLRTDPITGAANASHSGIDIAFRTGTEIKAVMSGKVIYVRYPTTGYGYHLAIHHGNGLVTLYAHCSKILVGEGAAVSQGDAIAEVGSTGRSTGPHLHFMVLDGGVPQNPREYLPTS